MMAGVVAMASVIEDFDTQPCKKSRKDGGSPIVKTITNYFSPVPKPAEKPFSSPRSNNITDYFGQKAPSSKEKTPEQLKENCQTPEFAEKRTGPEAAVKQQSQKQRRKASKAVRKLVEAETFSCAENSPIVEKPHDGRDLAAEGIGSCGMLGSDTAALIAQLTAEACVPATKTVSVEPFEEDGPKCANDVKLIPELSCVELSPILPSKDKAKQVKTVARNSRKARHSEPEEKEKESSLCDVSMEVNVDEASMLNNSTVTISFEDFVRSQKQGSGEEDTEDEQGREDKSNISTEAEEMDTDQLAIPKAKENVASYQSPFQVSPRTVTIQAEVHVISLKQEAAMAEGKLASIFTRRKGSMSPASSPRLEAEHQLPPSSLTIKRKSNVVLQEEDLELSVLESESMPKCSVVERKQFMAAFKQPSQDGSKAKTVKSQSNQKQPGDKAGDDADKVTEEDNVIPPSVEQVPAASQEDKVVKKKPTRKVKKKAKEEDEATTTPSDDAAEETVVAVGDVDDDEIEEIHITSTPSIPVVRRSKREAVIREAPELIPISPIRKTRKRNESKDTAAAAASNDSPANMSTQKRRRSKRTVFVAEMVCPPDTKESPIRIKFTRVHKNVPTTKPESGSGIKTSLATKTSNDQTSKRRQAKKLVEKARVIQQSKKTADKEKGTIRRSTRTEASTKMRYCEDEDSVICLEEDQTAPGKSKRRKPLRSLNEVLGKASVGKETKAVPGSKGASLGQEKTARKASAVISIFDDSSSENSQDDEQFKARKEFLKSGLPESFRKQIAKTAASRETYSLSCSSFQPVIHMKQPSNDCPLWSLLWPESSLLVHLKEIWCQTSNSIPSVSGSLCVKTKPERRTFFERGSGWRPKISESVRQLLMEEVSACNPPFPAQLFTTRFLKRRADQQQQSTASEAEAVTRVTSITLPAEPVGGKRKRMDDEGGMSVKVAKKQRAYYAEEKKSGPEPTKRRGRTRRARRASPEEGENEKALPSVETAPVRSDDDDSVVFIDDSLLGGNTGRKGEISHYVGREDVLWTDKYQPQHSSDIIGNTASVRRLHSWLKEWKLRADREERKKQKDKKQEEDSDWDCGEEDSQDGEDMLCNTMLITGPTGIGKTAAVYACAQELGFKVFEVNASSQRSGRLILSQLKEATQSHQVDSQGVNAHKPTYFNSYGTSSSAGILKLGSSPKKVNSPRRVVSSPRKRPQSPRGAKRGGLAPTSLANFFKTGHPTKETPNKKNEQTVASKKVIKANECDNKKKDPKSAPTPKEKNNEEQSKKTATSLILFEEVDVIFDDDSGFLAAIKTFMTTTKRPVILTTSDPSFSTMFDGNFEEILFKRPSVLDVGSFLQLLCLTEDTRTDREDIGSLLRLNGCDIRQSLLQLQFWARSAGGRHVTRPLTHTGKHAELKPETDEESVCAVTDTLPPCDTGCTDSMLGLLNVEPEGDIWERLRSPVEEMLCWELLANSKRRGVDLLYSNFETLLPLPHTQLTTSTFKPGQFVSASQDHTSANPKEMPPHAGSLHAAESAECSDDSSPIKMSHRMRKSKKRHSLPDQDGLHSDSEDSFLSLCKPQDATRAKEDVKRSLVSEAVKRKPLTPEERVKNLPISQCLESIADFFDNMSYMDSLMVHPEGVDNPKRMSPVGAVVKDGMTDESRAEIDRGSWERVKHVLEIPAAVEALSFHKCQVSVAAAWDKVQQLEGEVGQEAAAELTLPVAAHQEGYSFTQDGPSQPQLVQRRREVMESLMLRGVFGTPANRPAAALDYLPALRTICRSEQLKEQGKVKRRFLHYLDAIHLGLEKSTQQQLAEDFP
ncbi:ATPase family AAA domain-containing protein 5 isoform X2 [Cyclopterus lumpus]|uniref:ATPase family AAA domain-containing protein 5 isoform X2 n=1 Tax=Cyclopterus lumpus TaxID=8103 RepID=UPI0014862305|nr:ATPase family AAA domain-containing protein 5 isoform X2 [Cyclopterus lumpus]